MKSVVRNWCGAALILALVLGSAWAAQNQALEGAIALFEQREYAGAHEALLKIDRDALTADEQAQFDELLTLVTGAIEGQSRASRDLAAAFEAYQAGDLQAADELYRAVVENEYAPAANREHAAAQRERIARELQLRDVAEPKEPVGAPGEPEPVGEPEPTPAAQVAPEEPAVRLEEAPAPMPTGEPQALTPTAQLRLRDELLWQQAVARFEDLVAKAHVAMEAKDFTKARQLADTALQTVEASARYAEPVSKYEAVRAAAVRLQQEVADSRAAHDLVQAEKERAEIAKRVDERRIRQEQTKRETVQQLFNSSEQLRRERRFGEAAEVLREIIRIDPANAKARDQLEVVEDYESFAAQQQWLRDVRFEQRRALLNADEALIPWDYDVLYPKNWLELTRRRQVSGMESGVEAEDIELGRALDQIVPELRFEETEFEAVMAFLTDFTKLNISIDWTDLDDALLDPAREKPVTVRLVNLPLHTVLDEILKQVGGEVQLDYRAGGGLLRIATKDKLDRDKNIRIYDVRDLLVTVPQVGRPDFQQANQGLGQQGGGGGGQSIFGQGQGQQQQQQEDIGGAAQMDRLKEIIRATVEPDSWVEAGAGPGGASIQDMNGQLIIFQTSKAHGEVVNLLRQLRETQALQVSVEARFLDVTANFLEQFGVDLDFVFNSGSAGYDQAPGLFDPFSGAPVLVPRQYSRIGAIPATPPWGTGMQQGNVVQQPYQHAGLVPPSGGVSPHINEMTPIAVQQGSYSIVDPSTINTGVQGSFAGAELTPALSIAGSFLDNLQVDFLIRATQANQRSSIVQAPRAVMTNGQAVEIRIEGVRTYVASLEPVVGEAAALSRPITNQANSGISMWVQAVISADRRYSKLSIALLNQSEPTFERFETQRASGNSPGGFISLPSFSRITYTTTVSIPDGGTVLLGGFKQVGEVEIEAGVPILSKIPILKRAFTNQTTIRDTRTLLILLKSKILIQQEAEEEAFPTFSRLGG